MAGNCFWFGNSCKYEWWNKVTDCLIDPDVCSTFPKFNKFSLNSTTKFEIDLLPEDYYTNSTISTWIVINYYNSMIKINLEKNCSRCQFQIFSDYNPMEINGSELYSDASIFIIFYAHNIEDQDSSIKMTFQVVGQFQGASSRRFLISITMIIILFTFTMLGRSLLYQYRRICLISLKLPQNRYKELLNELIDLSYEKDIDHYSQGTCSICMNEFVCNNKVSKISACSHIFHPDCIRIWIKSSLESTVRCPLCNTIIGTKLDNEDNNGNYI